MIFSVFNEYFIKEAIPEFVRKLYLALETFDYQSIIGWTLNGKALQIHEPKKLESVVLPTVFNQKTLNSFVRQLNLYGFKKHEKGNISKMVFCHQFFRRDQIQNLIFIIRKRRGYQEPRELFDVETREFKDRQNSLCRGVMAKIESDIEKVKEKCPQLYESVSKLTKSYTQKKHHSLIQEEETKIQTSIPSSIPSVPSIPSLSSLSQFHQITTQPLYFYPMMASVTCFIGGEMMVPMMTSIISFPDLN